MKLNLNKYTTEQILGSYEFLFAQYIGGKLTPEELLERVPTVYIMGEVCGDVRSIYLARKDGNPASIVESEKMVIEKVSATMNVPEKVLREIYEDFLIQAVEDLKRIREQLS